VTRAAKAAVAKSKTRIALLLAVDRESDTAVEGVWARKMRNKETGERRFIRTEKEDT
jgi:hypothetical protein